MRHDLCDNRWLAVALAQADKITGQTADNPAVGCAICDKDGHLVGVGHTARGGRPHAETVALDMAGGKAKQGTAYVTLEPCAHQGQTGPCAVALQHADIARVVIAVTDPDSRVSGKGIALLKEAGITVDIIAHPKANRQMAGFLSRHDKGRPFISVKMATSQDGYIAARRDAQTWLTGPTSRRFVHDLRSRCDVLLTTSGTIAADNPRLDVRLEGYEGPQPALAILDSHASLPLDAACLTTKRDVYLYHRADAPQKPWPNHVRACAIAPSENGLSLEAVLADLHKRALGLVMVEAGAALFESLYSSKMIDECIWLRAPHQLRKGLLAWSQDGHLDFSAPASYITSRVFSLGDDKAMILHPPAQ